MNDISLGVRLFNESDFFSAHDVFEELWFDAERKDKIFYQGLVQISVGCYHLISGNIRGAKNQLSKGYTKLEKYLPSYYKVNLSSLLKEIGILIIEIERRSENFEMASELLPEIKFI